MSRKKVSVKKAWGILIKIPIVFRPSRMKMCANWQENLRGGCLAQAKSTPSQDWEKEYIIPLP